MRNSILQLVVYFSVLLSIVRCSIEDNQPHLFHEEIEYSDVWAVHLPLEVPPSRILSKYPFHHFRKLLVLDNIYAFHLHSTMNFMKRSKSDDLYNFASNLTYYLLNDCEIISATHQIGRSRAKRAQSFSDPYFPRQWNIVGTPGIDLNLESIWAEGIHGENVTVAIVDDGMEADHPEIAAQYNLDGSWNVINGNSNVKPGAADQDGHGTKCGGTATGRNNSICGVGVAYQAKVSAIRVLDSYRKSTDIEEAEALGYRPDVNYIYSASWGPLDDAQRLEAPGPLLQAVFEHNIFRERGGLGSIYIWANGNGGTALDNCNYDGYANSRYTISITATSQNATKPFYTEPCSAAVVSAPGGINTGNDIVAPSLRKTCVTTFGETSSAAPQAAGVAAMMMQVNPTLNWREFQDIFIRTARKNAPNDSDWMVNGVGRHVNHNFGYGLIDATAAVRLARSYNTLRHRRPYLSVVQDWQQNVPLAKKSRISTTLTVPANSSVRYVEHVVVQLWITSDNREQLEVTLKSPMGTPSVLATVHTARGRQFGYAGWNLTSIRHWDETAAGNWTLQVRAAGDASHTLTRWKLYLYGTDGQEQTLPPATTTPAQTTRTPETTSPPPTTPLPTTPTPVPTTPTPLPTTTTPVPTTTTPQPTTTTPAPTRTRTPRPTTPSPTTVEETVTSVPTETSPEPTATSPEPTVTTPEQTTTTPTTSTTPQPTTTTPAPTTTTPESTTTTPHQTTATPVPTTPSPQPTTTIPDPTTSPPESTTPKSTTLTPAPSTSTKTSVPTATTVLPSTTPSLTTPRPTRSHEEDVRRALIGWGVSTLVVLIILITVIYVVYTVFGTEDAEVRTNLLADVEDANGGGETNAIPMRRIPASTSSSLLAGEGNNIPQSANDDA